MAQTNFQTILCKSNWIFISTKLAITIAGIYNDETIIKSLLQYSMIKFLMLIELRHS